MGSATVEEPKTKLAREPPASSTTTAGVVSSSGRAGVTEAGRSTVTRTTLRVQYPGIQSLLILVVVMPPQSGSSSPARAELAAFLRSRRERLTPQRAGLPGGGRRRTPGLRREEVAMLAGVGVTWYTWLEQGRDINPSPEVLDAIAGALQLDLDERNHLWLLATGHPARPAAPDSDCGVVTSAHLALLAQLMPVPACIQSAKYDILASNAGYRFLINDLDDGPVADRNCLVRAFLDPEWAAAYADYDHVTSRMVGRLRAAMAEHLDDPAWTSFVDRMQAESPLFAELWERREIANHGASGTRFVLSPWGEVRVEFTRLWLDTAATVHLTVLQPRTPADSEVFSRMAASVADRPVVTARPSVSAELPQAARPSPGRVA